MNSLDLKPLLPWSQESECAVLGAMLADCGKAFDRAQPLTKAHFFDGRHRLIFGAIENLHGRGLPVDVVTVFEHLRDQGRADDAGGVPYLNGLAQGAYTAHRAGAYASKVRDMAVHRALLETLDKSMELASTPGGTPAEKLDQITTWLGELQRKQVARVPRTATEAALARLSHWEDLAKGRAQTGWPVFIPRLNHLLGGLRPGGLYYLAARPGVGKTSLSLELAARSGLVSLFLSQEMTEAELVDRAVACIGRVNYGALQDGSLTQDDWSRMTEAVSSEALRRLHLDDQGSLTLADIRAKAKSVPGLQLLVLDYLQLCAGAVGSTANRNSEIEQISRGLKALAKELGIAVVALSQLNRQVEQRTSKRPMLADLRDSGSIEQDADAVVMLWEVRKLSEDKKLIGLALAKNRQGRTGELALHFDGSRQSWGESTESLAAPIAQIHRRGLPDHDRGSDSN